MMREPKARGEKSTGNGSKAGKNKGRSIRIYWQVCQFKWDLLSLQVSPAPMLSIHLLSE